MRKLTLLMVTLVAAMGLNTAAAAADPTVQVLHGPTGTECNPLTVDGNDVDGGCAMDIDGTMIWQQTVGSSYWVSCVGEFELHVATDGTAYAESPEITACPGSAFMFETCESNGQASPWAGEIRTDANGEIVLDLDTCTTAPNGSPASGTFTHELVTDGDLAAGDPFDLATDTQPWSVWGNPVGSVHAEWTGGNGISITALES
jgi:hypothetical protein